MSRSRICLAIMVIDIDRRAAVIHDSADQSESDIGPTVDYRVNGLENIGFTYVRDHFPNIVLANRPVPAVERKLAELGGDQHWLPSDGVC